MKREPVTAERIMDALPTPPLNYSYRVEQFSKLCWRVWLINHQTFSYKDEDEEIKTVWGFVKSTGDVMKPKNAQKISSEKICKLPEITQDMCYTVIKPKYQLISE